MQVRQRAWILLLTLLASPAAAQSVEGPLDDPVPAAVAAEQLPARATRRMRKRDGAASTKAPAARAGDAALPEANSDMPRATHPRHAAAAAAPADEAVSLGFKWQGNNDTAEKTRVQNYHGDAAGTGAAVGLRLHF